MARLIGFEPTTPSSGNWYSIQMSYKRLIKKKTIYTLMSLLRRSSCNSLKSFFSSELKFFGVTTFTLT